MRLSIIGIFVEELDMDIEKRKKERANEKFTREELGPLLKLFSSIGITLTLGIVGFFLAGSYIDKTLKKMEIATHGLPVIVAVLAGVGLSIYWCYMRIAKHLAKYETRDSDDEQKENGDS